MLPEEVRRRHIKAGDVTNARTRILPWEAVTPDKCIAAFIEFRLEMLLGVVQTRMFLGTGSKMIPIREASVIELFLGETPPGARKYLRMGVSSAADSSDLGMLRRAQSGDSHALEQILTQYRGRLKRMVKLRLNPRLQRRVDPSDVVQEAYLEVSQKLSEYLLEPKIPFFLWLRLMTGQKLALEHRKHIGIQARNAAREVSLNRGANLAGARDVLTGGADEDIVIATFTAYDGNKDALTAMLAEWQSDMSYTDRIRHLQGTLPGGLNGSFFLQAATVRDDAFRDNLQGGSGRDWFWAYASDFFLAPPVTDEVVSPP